MKKDTTDSLDRMFGAAVVATLFAVVGAGMTAVMWGFDVNQTGGTFIVLWVVVFIVLMLGWREPLPPKGGKKAPTVADHRAAGTIPTPSTTRHSAASSAAAPSTPAASAHASSSGTARAATPPPSTSSIPGTKEEPKQASTEATSGAPAGTDKSTTATGPAVDRAATATPEVGRKPETLDQPRNGQADDLKQIKGVGPALEKLCNRLGFYHFDQIANWTDEEVAWVDEHLEGFKGRVSRDDWVAQAKTLASGESTEFSRKVNDGDVY